MICARVLRLLLAQKAMAVFGCELPIATSRSRGPEAVGTGLLPLATANPAAPQDDRTYSYMSRGGSA